MKSRNSEYWVFVNIHTKKVMEYLIDNGWDEESKDKVYVRVMVNQLWRKGLHIRCDQT